METCEVLDIKKEWQGCSF